MTNDNPVGRLPLGQEDRLLGGDTSMDDEEFLDVAKKLATGRYFPTKPMGERFVAKAGQLVMVAKKFDTLYDADESGG